jgi:hypothetical protein
VTEHQILDLVLNPEGGPHCADECLGEVVAEHSAVSTTSTTRVEAIRPASDTDVPRSVAARPLIVVAGPVMLDLGCHTANQTGRLRQGQQALPKCGNLVRRLG